MSYMALYRKWRPSTFDEVKGQDHIVTTLKNQIKYDRIGHAYLFCGTRGTGKTTVAKILAKAVNCENPKDGMPCEECEMCKAIRAGTSMNVIEIDAASNNGVDNIREIREEVAYSPTKGRFKVYIIDEVHMLSIGAFNALLKTLEEPPSYVIFILATTEANKIPITILSRCQRYDFRRISIDTISDRLLSLMKEENIEVEEAAIRYIAKAADGSMRDALSLLDQCIAFYLGKKLTYDNVLEVLGAVDTTVFSDMLRRIVASDTVGAIKLLENIVMQGRDLSQFVTDFTWYLRNLLLVKTSADAMETVGMSTENYKALVEEAKSLEEPVIMRYIRIMSELSNKIRYETQKRVIVELTLIKLMKPAMEKDYESLVNRIAVIEKQLEEGTFTIQAAPQAETVPAAPKEKVVKQTIGAVSEDIEKAAAGWSDIIGRIKSPFERAEFAKARVTLDGEKLMLVFDKAEDSIYFGKLNQPEIIEQLEDIIEQKIGKRIGVKLKQLEENVDFDEAYEDLFERVNMDIEIENEENDKEEFL